jgi:nucleoside-diphosphate-sugar epimerase
MKKVLLTGATGFIGRHCLPLLLEKGYQVHAVSTKPARGQAPGATWHQADLLDPGQVYALLKSVAPTHLLHLAWYIVPKLSWTSLENLRWVKGSLDLLQAFAVNNGRRIVTAGTCAEYDWRYGYCSEQVTPLTPATLYGVCKNSLQSLVSAASAQAGISSAWGRIFFLYGPHEPLQKLVSSVIVSLLRGQPAPCTHGNQIRDFLYVKDVAAAFVNLLESELTGPVNIASGKPVALKEIVSKIALKQNRPELLLLGAIPAPENEPALLVADTRRLDSELGWRPGYDLDRGLDETIDWWKNNLPGI